MLQALIEDFLIIDNLLEDWFPISQHRWVWLRLGEKQSNQSVIRKKKNKKLSGSRESPATLRTAHDFPSKPYQLETKNK